MKKNAFVKKMVLSMIVVIFMMSAILVTAQADLLNNPTTIFGFLKSINQNYGGDITTSTYYGDHAMYLSDMGGFGATTYYLLVTGRKEQHSELLENGIESIEFVTTSDALLNDPEDAMIELIETMVVQAETSLLTEEDTLTMQDFLLRDEIIANAKRLMEIGENARIIANLGPRWGAEMVRRYDFEVPVGDKIIIHLFRLARNVKFIPETPVISVGETLKLNAEIKNLTPDAAKVKRLTWLSDNASVLTVDQNGNIKGISKGEANVSVPIVDNGNPVFSHVSVRVVVGVKKMEMAEKKIDLLLCNDKEKGKTKLTYTYEPADADNPTVTWSSSNEKVVTVDEFGNVQAIGAGNAKITAISNGPQNHKKPASAICNVTVKQGVTEISLSEQSMTLQAGKRARLQVSYMPQNAANKKAVWESSDETVVKVDKNGNITAVAEGSAVITCRVADDSDISAVCTVNVSN